MVFTVIAYSAETTNGVYDQAGKLKAVDYTVTVTWDGTAVYAPLPSTDTVLSTMKTMLHGSFVRLKHVSIKSADVGNRGKFVVYAAGGSPTSHSWSFTMWANEFAGLDTDFLMDIGRRAYGSYGIAYPWFDTAPTNLAVMVFALYFEVV